MNSRLCLQAEIYSIMIDALLVIVQMLPPLLFEIWED